MTETDWLAAADPEPMLRGLTPPPSERKLRLFALAWCGRIDHLITDARSRAALAFVTSHVETTPNRKKGRPTVERGAEIAYQEACGSSGGTMSYWSVDYGAMCAADAARKALRKNASVAASLTAEEVVRVVCWSERISQDRSSRSPLGTIEQSSREQSSRASQADLLREILGNPFHPVAIDPSWLWWNDATVPRLAQSIYGDQSWDSLGVLADALEDAGCAEDAILDHLRSPGPHVRGCWAVDLLLGKG